MRPRVTWTRPEWSTGGLVQPLPALRAKYGLQLAELAEIYADIAVALHDGPKAQDVKHTLQRIIDDPANAQLHGLDADTDCALVRETWLLFQCTEPMTLPKEQLVQCARAAKDRAAGRPGRPNKHRLAQELIAKVLAISEAQLAADQLQEMLLDVLKETKLASPEPDTLRALMAGLRKAGQVF